MGRTEQQHAAAGSHGSRKDLELFWRIVAGLMLLVVAWTLWVLYQITPGSVVTPKAYATRIRPIGTQPLAIGALANPPPVVTPPALQPTAQATAADASSDGAQAAARAAAPGTTADTQATVAQAAKERKVQSVGLRLATEISAPAVVSTPMAGKQDIPKKADGRSGGAPAAGAAGKERP